MKAIMVMFDSLNRHMLPNYGCQWVYAPNFNRLGEKTITFENSFAGSLPCIPARRELHTGRYNFLHRSWGPIEPFDDSMPEILKKNGVYTHLVSDHQHYWEDGGATYHTRYSSWEIIRGQEGDPWKGYSGKVELNPTPFKMAEQMHKKYGLNLYRQDVINRSYMTNEESMPQAVTFKNGIEFIDKNYEQDQWFLQIETFDPHEPFFASQRFKEMYPDEEYNEEEFDWPPYAPVGESDQVVTHGRKQYAALVSMCDYYLGKVLDKMDEYDLWKDTLLIVNTDHGFMLGEHEWWGKSIMPTYNEIAHIPFFLWDPREKIKGERRHSLVQTIDIAPTLLDYFNVSIPEGMEGKVITSVIRNDKPVRDTAMFGYHGGHINITDGRYVYMLAPARRDNTPLFDYTLMPTHMREMFQPYELQEATLSDGFNFTKGCKIMKIKTVKPGFINPVQYGSKLFDLEKDPLQIKEIQNQEVELRLINDIRRQMQENDAPQEQYIRMGIPEKEDVSLEQLKELKATFEEGENFIELEDYSYEPGVYNQIKTLINLVNKNKLKSVLGDLKGMTINTKTNKITKTMIKDYIDSICEEDEEKRMIHYFVDLAGRTY